MPTKSLISRFKDKDVDKIIRSLERARNATQRSIDQFNNYRPEGKIKALKSTAEFNKQSGINELKKQVTRKPFEFPSIKINTQNANINSYTVDQIEILDYKSHDQIKMEMRK